MTLKTVGILVALAISLAACGEKVQTAQTRKSDVKPSAGGENPAYAAAGWKAGDQASWDEQMRNRAQGQNEYSRAAAQ